MERASTWPPRLSRDQAARINRKRSPLLRLLSCLPRFLLLHVADVAEGLVNSLACHKRMAALLFGLHHHALVQTRFFEFFRNVGVTRPSREAKIDAVI